jgi:hypothetical protein
VVTNAGSISPVRRRLTGPAEKVGRRRYGRRVTAIRQRRHLTATVCGTFNLGLPAVTEAVDYFHASGVTVLSPTDPTPVAVVNGFLYVASDRHRDPGLVEARHIRAIAESNFVWLVAPDGYIGVATAYELGVATALQVPVFTLDRVTEPDFGRVVERVASVRAALDRSQARERRDAGPSFLVDPDGAATRTHVAVGVLHHALTSVTDRPAGAVAGAARQVRHALSGI